MRVRIPTTEAYAYPDVVVYCGEGKWLDDHFDTLENPGAVVEVLSPSTEKLDRLANAAHYKLMDSLQAYIVVSQEEVYVECSTRDGENWVSRQLMNLLDDLYVPGLEVAIPLAEIYDRVSVGPDARLPKLGN